MDYMLRAPSVEALVKLNERFDKVVLYAAKAAECEAEIDSLNGYMPLLDDMELGKLLEETVHSLHPGVPYDNNKIFFASCTDMGDVAAIIPGVHGYVPSSSGTSHGIDYRISDPYVAYVETSIINTLLAVELLHGDGEKGRKIAERKKDLLSIEEYIKIIDKINMTKTTADL